MSPRVERAKETHAIAFDISLTESIAVVGRSTTVHAFTRFFKGR